MLFFCDGYPDALPHHRQGHVESIERGLRAHFDVVAVSGDCDYREMVDAHKPDIVLFSGGGDLSGGRFQRVSNIDPHCSIPRAGLVGIDGQSPARRAVIDRLDSYGVQIVFTYNTGFGAAWPAIADRLIYWPWFVDGEIFKDYALPRDIPVAMIGAGFDGVGGYPWRKRVSPLILSRFPAFVATRPRREVAIALHGEAYARILNRSWVGLGCGGSPRILVRKLLEIPACRSLLVTERTETVEAMGFADGVNCVFADADTIVDRLNQLFGDPDHLRLLADAGYRFVHARHTAAQRTQMLEWLRIHRQLRPGQRIVQPSPVGPLAIAEQGHSSPATVHLGSDGHIVTLRRAAQERLRVADYEGAKASFDRLVGHYTYLNEAHVGLAAVWLGLGRPGRALAALGRVVRHHHGPGGNADPVECAYLVVALLALRRPAIALDAASGQTTTHPAFEAALAVLERRIPGAKQQAARRPVASIYTAPFESAGEWQAHFEALLGVAARMVSRSLPRRRKQDGSSDRPLAAVFGAGPTSAAFRRAHEAEFTWAGYVDNNAELEETTIDNLPVILPEDLEADDVDVLLVCAASHAAILTQLRWLGWPLDKVRVLDRASGALRSPAEATADQRGSGASGTRR